MARVTVEELLESGAHFGHLTRRWNPKMKTFIFGERNGIHIIDLRKTQLLVELAAEAAQQLASRGGRFMFVGTKKQAKEPISREAERCGSYHVTERWLGGMLTNFSTVRKSIKRLDTIEKMFADGTADKLRKKERLLLSREQEKLQKVFGGIREMKGLPTALFIVDIKKEHIAIQEAKKLGIPTFAVVDTNTDPGVVDYPIPANDDSSRTIELISRVFANAIGEGRATATVVAMDSVSDADRASKEGSEDESGKVKRKMRARKASNTAENSTESDAPEAAATTQE